MVPNHAIAAKFDVQLYVNNSMLWLRTKEGRAGGVKETKGNKSYMRFMEIVRALVTTETSCVHNSILWLCGLVQRTWSVEELRR